jgi:hypothetical protein
VLEKHRALLGTLHIALGASTLLAALIVFVVIVGGGALSGHRLAVEITSQVGSSIAALLTLLALPGLVGGVALLARRPWAPYVVFGVSALNLTNLPVGTAIAVYSLWVLLKDEGLAGRGHRGKEPDSARTEASASP